MLHYSLWLYKSNKVTYLLSQSFGILAITPINSVSLIAERCYLAFTHLCTSAIVLKWEQMLIIIFSSHTVALKSVEQIFSETS